MLRRCSKISFLSKFNKCFHVLFTALIFRRQRFWFTFCYFPAYQLHSLFAAWLVLVMSLFKSGDFQRGTLVLIYYFFPPRTSFRETDIMWKFDLPNTRSRESFKTQCISKLDLEKQCCIFFRTNKKSLSTTPET